MREDLNLKDFDILGIITLNDVQGIEEYVTPVIQDGKIQYYLSRSKEYYNVKSMTELALNREELKTKLTSEHSKRNFVILENMLNCSGKVYFKKFEQYILSGKDNRFESQMKQAKECLVEDVRNILVMLQGKGTFELNPRNILPTGDENSAKRAIEMDNKAMLYIFTRALKMQKNPEQIEVVTPGYGSIYIGPFFRAMYGYDFTNTLKSKYIEETTNISDARIGALMSSDRPFEDGKMVLLLDDNIGTGATMLELQKDFKDAGIKDFLSGAIQYNWRNYLKVSTGEKKDIDRFEINNYDIITPFNYAGHKLYEHAIEVLHSSGSEYIDYLNSKSYRKKECCDLEGSIRRGVLSAKKTGLELSEGLDIQDKEEDVVLLEAYQNGPDKVTNPISKRIINVLIDDVKDIVTPQDLDER